ncbi:MAG: NAD(P)-dependent oxidoreductase [Planctomycetota bacterium]
MADSFTFFDTPAAPPAGKRRVLVTGARGNIGSRFAAFAAQRYDLRLMCYRLDGAAEQLRGYGEVVEGDITSLERMYELCDGIDTVIHLAGAPDPSTKWATLLPLNIQGTYNVMVAAHAAGCRRVVFASSIHAVSGYPADRQVQAEDPVNPGDLYGVSKCFGEALGRYMAEQHGLSVIVNRICWFEPPEKTCDKGGIGMLDAYVSPRDMNQMLALCVDDTKLKFAIVHGLSDNRFKRLDLAETRELLGYEPEDDLTDMNPVLRELNLGEKLREHDQTGDDAPSGIREDLDRLRG